MAKLVSSDDDYDDDFEDDDGLPDARVDELPLAAAPKPPRANVI